MKNQGEKKNKNNIFDSHEFIHFAYNFFPFVKPCSENRESVCQ